MKIVMGLALGLSLVPPSARAQTNDTPPAIVAAENFYGDIARQIAGPDAIVSSILSNPDDDPHLFEVSPSVARDLSKARIVIYNGMDYDPWMPKMLSANQAPGRRVIVVAELLNKKPGTNPHLWYDPPAALAVARAIAATLESEDPANKGGYEQRLQAFIGAIKPVEDKVAAIRKTFAGTPVTATEPVFGYMAAALGFNMRNERFQLAVMNDTEPAASDVAAFEDDLRNRRVKILFYNSQATTPTAQRLANLARDNKISIVGVTETEPQDKTFQQWMLGELEAVRKALPGER